LPISPDALAVAAGGATDGGAPAGGQPEQPASAAAAPVGEEAAAGGGDEVEEEEEEDKERARNIPTTLNVICNNLTGIFMVDRTEFQVTGVGGWSEMYCGQAFAPLGEGRAKSVRVN
jgi:hypothetical protein